MKCLRIYSTSDRESHFDEVEIPTSSRQVHPKATAFEVSTHYPATRIHFTRIPAGAQQVDWHTVPGRVLTVRLDGSADYQASDGDERLVRRECSTCHGAQGISASPEFPNLAGQTRQYLQAQLKAFRDHSELHKLAVSTLGYFRFLKMGGRTLNTAPTSSKVPTVTFSFWIVYIAATTLGETGGDAVSDTLDWGYLGGTAFFLVLFVVLAIAQILSSRLRPPIYWATIVASTMFGTTMADFADRSLGLGYASGSTVLFVCLLATLGVWYRAQGTIAVDAVTAPRAEIFYWVAITFSQTLGTALGDWVSDGWDLGSATGALIFGAALAVLVGLYYWTNASRVLLFWAALILTRPLGATLGDFLDQPHDQGGLALSRPLASAIIAAFIILCLFILPKRAKMRRV